MNSTSQNTSDQSTPASGQILSTLLRYKLVWIIPTLIGVLLSVVYVTVIRKQTWSAKQSLIVRDDLLGQAFKPGRFDSLESMKSAQETILEIARKPNVIRNALQQLGPASSGLFGAGDWPSDEVIENVQGMITFSAPNGAEFGKTEVIVLNTQASTRERSRKFIEFLLQEIIAKVDDVRTLRLESMEFELTQIRDAARNSLDISKSKLQEMDELLGIDVGAIGGLVDSQSSDSPIKRDISQLELEKRQAETQLEILNTILAQLSTCKSNPDQAINLSSELIRFQPPLDDLNKEMIRSQQQLSSLMGQYSDVHPQVISAKHAIETMKHQMYLELDGSIQSIRDSISSTEKQIAKLDLQLDGMTVRLHSLASKRAEMATLTADLQKRTEMATDAERNLAEIQGLADAKRAQLLTPVDEPQVSTRPDGLGKKAMIFAGGLGGLMLGLGFVMLIAPTTGGTALISEAQLAGILNSRAFESVAARASSASSSSASMAKQLFGSSKEPRTRVCKRSAGSSATVSDSGCSD